MIKTGLSARIRRRNNNIFKGEGTSSGWIKTTPYGDYRKDCPWRLADKAREIGKNGNRTLHKRNRAFDFNALAPRDGILSRLVKKFKG